MEICGDDSPGQGRSDSHLPCYAKLEYIGLCAERKMRDCVETAVAAEALGAPLADRMRGHVLFGVAGERVVTLGGDIDSSYPPGA